MQNKSIAIKIVFFGTPDFSVRILASLIHHNLTPVAVVTVPDKPVGRKKEYMPSAIKAYATENTIPVLEPETLRDPVFLKELRGYHADIFTVASFGRLLPKTLLDIPLKGVINVHPSLLPRHRGASPIQTAILKGDVKTGVTLMLTDAEMDHGPIIAKSKPYDIQNFGYKQLHDELAKQGGDLLAETLPKWIAGEITPQEQDHTKATFTKLFTKEDGHINWNRSVKEIDRHIRAFEEWPGTYSFYEDGSHKVRRVKILKGHASDQPSPGKPGTVVQEKNGSLAVCTKDNLFIVEFIQMEGKRPVSGDDFLNGQSPTLRDIFH
ncbi:MAG: methionyl-tRNA formyltransferase [Candidatus Ryanbacteria bacterium CG10_big_fil_rev_8_21_14_0_10_43_42]|uniref:Methionyl-tRNA formyltransferase n=1 Tax=Candidatus Ryanbacteria bacterium CG10_big_fil_rev_8_21_14_0_10_43_42 TaxID=1974864 RepID=A0A2M8KVY8_9BACT|nr:MAG: methionyl-tRNA formyltransferase [Candidatus Ryanbacteria bacterium CG10_big_fil_rev_8_21_14_0_10_43_42]